MHSVPTHAPLLCCADISNVESEYDSYHYIRSTRVRIKSIDPEDKWQDQKQLTG